MEPIKGRWGFYPCSYELYKKLKRLNLLCLAAYRRERQHDRWWRKDPQNRVIRPKKGTPNRRKTAVAPIPEPVRAATSADWDVVKENYRRARYPVETAELVSKLSISEAQVDTWLAELEAWYRPAQPEVVS